MRKSVGNLNAIQGPHNSKQKLAVATIVYEVDLQSATENVCAGIK